MPLSTLAAAFLCTLPLNQVSNNPPEQVVKAAAMLGIDAHTLACAGVHGGEVGHLLDRLDEHFDDYLSCMAAQEDAHAAQNEIFTANAALRLDPADTEAASRLTAAEAALDLAIQQSAARRDALILTLMSGLADAGHRSVVFGASPRLTDVPGEFRHAAGSDEEARVLAWAVRLRDRVGSSDLPPEASAVLTAAEGMTIVQTARLWRTTQSTPNQLAIEQWVLTH